MVTPFGITCIPGSDYIAVVSMAASERLSIYDANGNCITHITAAPLNAGTPNGIAYHATSQKIIITCSTDHAIYSINLDGSGSTQIFLNRTRINTPRAVITDADGYIYVSSTGTDTIEKLFFILDLAQLLWHWEVHL
jgi:DNA-binding beta-propeller fold protein YncE